jgi:hypothetical protein
MKVEPMKTIKTQPNWIDISFFFGGAQGLNTLTKYDVLPQTH